VTDNCDSQVEVQYNEITQGGNCADSYTIVRTWTATDNCANSSIAIQNILVEDTTDPIIGSIPSDMTVECDNLPFAGSAADIIATDNCDALVEVNYNETIQGGSCADTYTMVRTWTATDNCGNTARGTQRIEVEDTTPPFITGVPNNQTLSCGTLPTPINNLNGIIGSDNCDSNVEITISEQIIGSTGCTATYQIIRTFIATDDCGNSTVDSQTITIEGDTEAPILTGVPNNINLECGELIPPAVSTVLATDNCDSNVEIIFDEMRVSGACNGAYQIVRTWTAIDECGNETVGTQTIDVGDNTPPVISGVPGVIELTCGEIPEIITPTATDNCDIDVSIFMNEFTNPGTCASNYTITRTWIATDECGNSSVTTQLYNVGDNTPPVMGSIPADITIECDETIPSAPNVEATDDCDSNVEVIFEEQTQQGNCEPVYQIIRTWTATDECGNVSTGSQVIYVEDNTAPIFTNLPLDMTVDINAGETIPVAETVTETIIAVDNCDNNVEVTVEEIVGDGCIYSIIRTWTATDECGNEVMDSQEISVLDSPDVIATFNEPVCLGGTLELDASIGGLSYDWEGPNGTTYTGQSPAIPNLTAEDSGIYTVTIDYGDGCIGTASVEVNVGYEITTEILNNYPVCEGDDIELSVAAGTSFNWSGPNGYNATGQSILIEDASILLGGSTYTVTVTNGNNCSAIASTTIEILRAPTASAASSGPVCQGALLELYGNGGESYNWTGPNGYSSSEANPVINNIDLEPGIHIFTLEVTNIEGCTNSIDLEVEITPGNIVTVSDDLIACIGETVILEATGETAGSQYIWTGPGGFMYLGSQAVLNDANTLMTGEYTVTVADGSCQVTQTVIVTVQDCNGCEATAEVASVSPENCNDQNGTASIIPSDYFYQWNDGAIGSIRDDLSNGIYIVSVTDTEGCTTELVVTIEESGDCDQCIEPVVENTIIIESSCGDANGSVSIEVLGDEAAYEYYWAPNVGISNDTGNVRTALPAGVYEVIISNAGIEDCETVISVTVDNTNGPIVSTTTIESATCGLLDGTVGLLPADLIYTWTFDGLVSSTRDDLAAGIYEVEVIDPLVPNCPRILSIEVLEESGITAEAIVNNQPTCGENNGTVSIEVTSGDATGATYTWSDNGYGRIRTDLVAGPHSVTIEEVSGCITEVMVVLVDNVIQATIEIESDVEVSCIGSTDGTVNYTILPGAGFALSYTDTIFDASGIAQTNGSLGAGDYCILVWDANGCQAGQNCFTVTEPSAISIDISSEDEHCEEAGSILIDVTGGSNTYTYDWLDLDGTVNIEDRGSLPAGEYTIIVTDSEGCQVMATIEIIKDCPINCDVPEVVIDITQTSCGEANGNIEITGLSNYVYTWSPVVSNNANATDLAAGSYTVTIADINDPSCNIIETIIVGTSDGPQVTGTTTAATCNEGGTASLSPVDGTSNYTYTWEGGLTGNEQTDLASGPYEVTVADESGCEEIVIVMIEDDCSSFGCSLPIIAQINTSDATCGESNGTIDIELSSIGNYIYTWEPTVSDNASAIDLAAGPYTVTISVENDPTCNIIETIIIGTSDGPQATVSTTPVTCEDGNTTGGTVTLSPLDYTYEWSNGLIGAVQTDLAAGPYLVEISDGSGCINMIEVIIGNDCIIENECMLPVITNSTIQDASCGESNGSVTIVTNEPSEYYTYTWLPNVSESEVATGLSARTYTVIVADIDDVTCDTTLTIVIENTDGPEATVSSSIAASCDQGGSVVLNPSTYSYNWSTGGTGASQSGLAAGPHQVTVTDASTGCTDILEVEVEYDCEEENCDLLIAINEIATPNCGSADGEVSIEVTGGSGNYDYLWNTGYTEVSSTSLIAGVYAVTITDNIDGCTSESTFVLRDEVLAGANIELTFFNTDCYAGPSSYEINYDNGFAAPAEIILQDAAGDIFANYNSDAGSIAELVDGYYCMVVKDANECLAGEACFVVSSAAPLTVDYTTEDVNCENEGSIFLLIAGGNMSYDIQWGDTNSDEATRTELEVGTYKVTITDGDGCEVILDNILIMDDCEMDNCETPVVSIDVTDSSCESVDGGILLTPQTTGNYIYNWSNFATGNTLSNIPAGTYTVTIADVDASTNGEECFTIETIVVNSSEETEAHVIEVIPATCENGVEIGGSAVVGPSLIYNYTWSNNAVGTTQTNLEPGLYYITVTSINNCQSILEIIIEDDCEPSVPCDDPIITVDKIDAQCGMLNGSINLTVVGESDYSIEWSIGGVIIDNVLGINGLDAGLYSYSITDVNNPDCTYEDAIAIDNDPGPDVAVESYTSATCENADGTATLTEGDYTYEWNDSGVGFERTDLSTGTYYVTITDVNDCITIIKVTIGDDCEPDDNCGGSYVSMNISCEEDGLGYICLEIPLSDFNNYQIMSNGQQYSGPVLACDFDTIMNYDFQVMIGGGFSGPYYMNEWTVNGQMFSGEFIDVAALADSMNVWDNIGNWVIDLDNQRIEGGSTDNEYGDMVIDQLAASNTQITMSINRGFEAHGSALGEFTEGEYELLITNPSSNCPDTIALSVWCLADSPDQDTIFVTTPEFTPIEICTEWDPINGEWSETLSCFEPSQGTMDLGANDNCILFDPEDMLAGDQDTMCVTLCDAVGDCYPTVVIVLVTPECETPVNIFGADDWTITTYQCEQGGEYCLDISLHEIHEYTITDNGSLYEDYGGCGFDSLFAFSYIFIPDQGANGPYSLDGWTLNDSLYTGTFEDLNDLVNQMNTWDPLGNWIIDESSAVIVGGYPNSSYNDLLVSQPSTGTISMIELNALFVPFQTSLTFSEGLHEVILTNVATGCSDTIDITVICADEDLPGTVIDTLTYVGYSDTLCIEIDPIEIGEVTTITNLCEDASYGNVTYEIDETSACLIYSGVEVGQDTFCLEVCGTLGCDTTHVLVEVINSSPDTIYAEIPFMSDSTFCIDSDELPGMDTGDYIITNICEDASGEYVLFDIIEGELCVFYEGVDIGTETACIIACNEEGFCDTTVMIITVVPEFMPPNAINDDTMTVVDVPVQVNIMVNDSLHGEEASIEIILYPENGTIEVDDENHTVMYMPEEGFCGSIDSFVYSITTPMGSDTATVYIEILCEQLTIFNGISPNGDGVNDMFTIVGIERFPGNSVCIFNRWGNQVYRTTNYSNQNGWTGKWAGKDLPDGTYFYIIDAGIGGKYSGYVQLHR